MRSYLEWIDGYLAGNGFSGTEVADVVREQLDVERPGRDRPIAARAGRSLRAAIRRVRET